MEIARPEEIIEISTSAAHDLKVVFATAQADASDPCLQPVQYSCASSMPGGGAGLLALAGSPAAVGGFIGDEDIEGAASPKDVVDKTSIMLDAAAIAAPRPTREEQLKWAITVIYHTRNPAKLHGLDQVFEKYRGEEASLYL